MTDPSQISRDIDEAMAKLRLLDLFSGYTIREDGQVVGPRGRPIKPQFSNVGYLRVELAGRKYSIHRLLAEAFIPNPEGKSQVNHINGDKADNRLENLEWVTQSENMLHAYKAGLQVGYRKSVPLTEAHKRALCGSRWNYERHVYALDGKTFDNLWDASEHFGVSRQTVLNRCKSPSWPTWSKQVERVDAR